MRASLHSVRSRFAPRAALTALRDAVVSPLNSSYVIVASEKGQSFEELEACADVWYRFPL